VDFTREPIIESVITPKEGYKLVIRSSKGLAQEEYLVDSVEVVTFGGSCFYRSLERPKCFLVPIGDYELIEVRETRMVLKTAHSGGERGSVKISANRPERSERPAPAPVKEREETEETTESGEPRQDKGKRRRQSRRRRGREETTETSSTAAETPSEEGFDGFLDMMDEEIVMEGSAETAAPTPPSAPAPVKTLLPPPKRLISDTIARYKEDEKFKGAFMSPSEQNRDTQSEAEESESELPFAEGDGLGAVGTVSETISEETKTNHSSHWTIPEIVEEQAVQKNDNRE
jgi:hypothetical protein